MLDDDCNRVHLFVQRREQLFVRNLFHRSLSHLLVEMKQCDGVFEVRSAEFVCHHYTLNCSSISTWYPETSRLVSLAMPTTAINSLNISSVMPFFLAPAVCEAMQ